MAEFTDKTIFQRRKDLLSSRMDQDTVMMHPESGKYFSLNPVATRIWEMLETPMSFEQIVETLLNEFNVSPEVCNKETREFIKTLIEKDIIEVKE